MTKARPLFEHITCSRCGGTGNYSYNQMHGSRCYGCSGTGYTLTKRGEAAQRYLEAMRQKPVTEVKVGDMVRFDMFTRIVFARVESIESDTLNPGQNRVNIQAKDRNGESIGFGTFWSHAVTMGFTADEKLEQRSKALAYQASLTKDGKPSAKAKKAVPA